jgi:signal transduction histidine kinase
MLLLSRRVDGPRWTESESSAALDVGHDLGRAILSTRSHERELEVIGELQRLDRYRTQLISTVSHELKSPLGVILGHLELLGELPGMPMASEPSLRAMGRSATRLASVVDDLLLLGRMENPDHPLVRVPVDLAAVVDEVLQDVWIAADQHGITLAPPDIRGDAVLGGDPGELLRLVSNLVSNAVKYSEPHGRVSVALHHTGSAVVLRVADEGIGISEADLGDLFTEFFRSTNPAAVERPGTGLGLTIVQRIVNRHEGRIEVESTLGRGTTVTVTLPDA